MLTFNETRWETTFPIDARSTEAISFFAQYLPTKFVENIHYLKLELSGEDIKPIAEEDVGHHSGDEEEGKPWGTALGVAALINLVTFSGIVFAIPCVSTIMKKSDPTFAYAGFASFAAGAILSCAFFLLLFESTHLIASGWEEKRDQNWRWGTMILLGLILPVLAESLVGATTSDSKEGTNNEKQGGDVETQKIFKEEDSTDQSSTFASPFAAKSFSEKARLIFAICFGDFMHNLCDGFFVGAAFKECNRSMAWGVAIGTMLHEFPQELSDFLILTGPQVGLSTLTALLINFVAGTSVIVGTIIVLAADIESSTTGLLLAFGAGVYLQIGCVECMPKMINSTLSPMRKLVCLFAFTIGAVLIGLVLLDHKHCGGDDHGHGDSHGH